LAIASRFSGKALDLYGLNTNNGAQVQLWTYWGGKNQQWQLVPITPKKNTPYKTAKSVVF
jgi:arabinan endo-1,5-alpha-L-arabinosidase